MTPSSFGRYQEVLPGMVYTGDTSRPSALCDVALAARVRYEEPAHLYRRVSKAAQRIQRTLVPDIRRLQPTQGMVLQVGMLDGALLHGGLDLIEQLARGPNATRRILEPEVSKSNERKRGGIDCLYLMGGAVPSRLVIWARSFNVPAQTQAALDLALWDPEVSKGAWCANLQTEKAGLRYPPEIVSAYALGKQDLLDDHGMEEVGRVTDELYPAFATGALLQRAPDISRMAEESYLSRLIALVSAR